MFGYVGDDVNKLVKESEQQLVLKIHQTCHIISILYPVYFKLSNISQSIIETIVSKRS